MPVDTFSLIRSLLENQTSPGGGAVDEQDAVGAKVVARSCETFVTERPGKWLQDYGRRCGQRETGFDSLPHVPYRPFAGLKHTDTYRLIADTWGLPLANTSREVSVSGSSKDCTRTSSVHTHHTIRVAREKADGKETKTRSRTAGLSDIQLYLNSTSRTAREVAAGSAFYHTLPREEDRKRFLQRMRAPKQTKRDGVSVSVHNPSIFLPLLVPTAASKTCLTSVHLTSVRDSGDLAQEEDEEKNDETVTVCQRVGPNIHVAMAAAHFKMHYGHHAKKKEISSAKKLQMRHCLVKVKTVYSIMCSLYNIKTRDLKEKRPLTLEAVKQMSVKPLPNREGTHHHSHRLTSHTHNSHTPSLHFHPHKTAGDSVETWEDLIAMNRHHDPCSAREDQLSASHTRPPLSAHQTTHMRLPHRVIPPWQKQVVFVDCDEKSSADPAVAIEECIHAFQTAKDQISEQTKSWLGKREQSRMQALTVKARELKLGVNREICLREMRETAYNIGRSERANEKNRPAWYGKLEKEVGLTFKPSVVGSDRQLNAWKTVAKWFLERLKFFLFSDLETIPRVLEKLCLFVMSLPPDQLCLAPVLESVEFVLEMVLEVPVRLCRQWLEMRCVPVNGVPLPSNPVIVLGQTV